MLFATSTPNSPAGDISPAEALRRSTRPATVAASAYVVRRAFIFFCAHP
jgi:hypothetical protein